MNRILRYLCAAALLVAAAGCSYVPVFERTGNYEFFHGSADEPWCSEGDDAYAIDEDAMLVGPQFSVAVQCRYIGNELPSEAASRLPTLADRPAVEDDGEFIVNLLSTPPDESSLDLVTWPVRSWVSIANLEFELDAPPQRGDWIVVTAPVGAEAVLWIEEDGRAQGLDLRTGERVEPVPAYYTDLEDLAPTSGYRYEELYVANGGETAGFSCVFDGGSAWRAPWDQDLGWAPEGTVFVGFFFMWCSEFEGGFTWTLDEERAVTLLSGEAGGVERLAMTPVDGGVEVEAVVVVPDDDAEVTVAFAPYGVVLDDQGREWRLTDDPEPTEWTAEF